MTNEIRPPTVFTPAWLKPVGKQGSEESAKKFRKKLAEAFKEDDSANLPAEGGAHKEEQPKEDEQAPASRQAPADLSVPHDGTKPDAENPGAATGPPEAGAPQTAPQGRPDAEKVGRLLNKEM